MILPQSRGCFTIDRSERTLLAAISLVSLLPFCALSPQAAQSELRVRLQSSEGIPISGALLALLDPNDTVVAEGLSTERGTRMLRAASGVYRVRARRIGFLPFVSPPVAIPRQDELLLAIETSRVADRILRAWGGILNGGRKAPGVADSLNRKH